MEVSKKAKVKEPDLVKQYKKIQEFINENETYMNKLADDEIDAEYKGEFERKRALQHVEANIQEVVNLMYEVVGFIESKWLS